MFNRPNCILQIILKQLTNLQSANVLLPSLEREELDMDLSTLLEILAAFYLTSLALQSLKMVSSLEFFGKSLEMNSEYEKAISWKDKVTSAAWRGIGMASAWHRHGMAWNDTTVRRN